MAARDNVLYSAAVASGTSAGTVVPLSLLYGIENVRQGYGKATLKNIRAVFQGMYGGGQAGVPIEIKNSNWIDSAGLAAIKVGDDIAYSRDSLSFMRGRDMELIPNTSFTINATVPANTTAAGNIYVLLEIEYSSVPGFDAEKQKFGAPVIKKCTNSSVSGSANVPVSLGSFDNLLQNTEYILSEVSLYGGINETYCYFLVVEGFSNQRGLTRIFPVRNYGIAEQIEGSVVLTKQTYNLSLICGSAPSSASFTVAMEMIANKN